MLFSVIESLPTALQKMHSPIIGIIFLFEKNQFEVSFFGCLILAGQMVQVRCGPVEMRLLIMHVPNQGVLQQG